jgi:hypothetical protein
MKINQSFILLLTAIVMGCASHFKSLDIRYKDAHETSEIVRERMETKSQTNGGILGEECEGELSICIYPLSK